MQTFRIQRLERQKGQQQASDKPLPEIGQVVVHKAHHPQPVRSIQSQTTLQNWKTISKPSQHTDSSGLADRSLTLPQRKGARQRNKPPVNQNSENPTPKQDGCWATELISSRNWGQHSNLNCNTSLREELTMQLLLKEEILQVITEFHGDVSRHVQPKCIRVTQEIPRHQK
jgi:hypothetical protein